ncbi:MAG: hypothetical protein U5J98_01380 [Halobacteriales archaeon]|nr:hypothetical protein [Halobacteriales archaeon]
MFRYLQIGGSPDLVSVGVLVLIVAGVLAYWVYKDAMERGRDNAALWAVGIGILTLLTLIGGLIGLDVYIYTRS